MNHGGRAEGPAQLGKLQRQLERTYDVRSPHGVEDFLVTDRAFVHAVERGRDDAREVDEKLLIVEADDGIDLALYVDRSVLDRLRQADPTVRLDRGNLADFCTALEGVSHFVYLCWNAVHAREITLLELELQAEVDKFVSASLLLSRQGRSPPTLTLHDLLFGSPSFDEQLGEDELLRYRDANRYAGKYCRSLADRFLGTAARPGRELMVELRRFYRLPQASKLRHIETTAA